MPVTNPRSPHSPQNPHSLHNPSTKMQLSRRSPRRRTERADNKMMIRIRIKTMIVCSTDSVIWYLDDYDISFIEIKTVLNQFKHNIKYN